MGEEMKGSAKYFMQRVHDACLQQGVHLTAKEFDLPIAEVRQITMQYEGWDGTWTKFLIRKDLETTFRNQSK